MSKITTIIIFVALNFNLIGQTIQVSDKLILTKLTDKTYIHTCQNNNGLVFINGDKALIVSTPDSDLETQNLIDWVVEKQKARIVGYVIDRWHSDAMEGLDIVHKNEIKSYSFELTRQIANEKGLPIPQIGFDPKKEILVGNEKIICHYLGEAHTKDGIVVWIPSEQILFGGNEIRSYNGWVGNIGDASLEEWSETAKRVKNEYGSAKTVIPGHGKHGGIELIDYTINLYRFNKNIGVKKNEILKIPNFKEREDFIIKADKDSTNNTGRVLENAHVIVQDSTKYIEIESPLIKYRPDRKRIDSETGRLRIYDKTIKGGKIRTDVYYKKLILIKVEDSEGLRVILKGIEE